MKLDLFLNTTPQKSSCIIFSAKIHWTKYLFVQVLKLERQYMNELLTSFTVYNNVKVLTSSVTDRQTDTKIQPLTFSITC